VRGEDENIGVELRDGVHAHVLVAHRHADYVMGRAAIKPDRRIPAARRGDVELNA
jgi:hypothetical protein